MSFFRVVLSASLVLLCTFSLYGQEKTGDPLIDIHDNPTGRAEYELMKRADPATGIVPNGMRERELRFAETLPTREGLYQDAVKDGAVTLAAPVVWGARGPNNQGGRTRALGIDISDESVILAGGVSGGMWRSENRGESWLRVTNISDMQSVTCLAQDPRPGSQNVWYYGTGEQRANSANLPGDGIFKSVDGGRSWKQLASTVKNSPQSRDQMFDYVHRIVVDPSNPAQDEVYAACYGGITRSTDGGESWNAVLGDLSNSATYCEVAITSDGVLYATLNSSGRDVEGIWRSVDGVNWTDITPPNFPNNYGKISIGIAPSNENKVYFFGFTPGNGKNDHSLWVYEHKGGGQAVWEDRSEGLSSVVESYSSYCIVVRVHPLDEDVVFVGHMQFQRSTDGLRDVKNLRTLMGSGQHADQHEIVFFPSNPDMMLSGHDGGVSFTSDNRGETIQWESLNKGYETTQFYSVAIDPVTAGSNTIIGGTQDNGSWFLNSTENNADWNKVFGADGGFCAIADSGTDYYTSYQKGQIYRSTIDENGKRLRYTRIDPEDGSNYLFIHPFTLDPSTPWVMYLPEGKNLWRNSDLREIPLDNRSLKAEINWENLDNARLSGSGLISAVGVSRTNPSHTVYYGTNQGELFKLNQGNVGDPEPVEISANGMSGGYINCIAVDPHDGNKVLVAISSYNRQSLFYSEDGGETWEAVGGNLEENSNGTGNGPSVSWAAILPVDELQYYLVGTTTGLYSTTRLNGDDTQWVQEGASTIGNVVVDMVAARESDGFVAVGTHGHGVYSAYLNSASTVTATLRLSKGTINFGQVAIGETAYDTVAITNVPSSARDITGTVNPPEAPFALVSGGGAFTLSPGQDQSIVFSFTPDSVKLVSSFAILSHDATTPGPPTNIWMSGEGIADNTNTVADPERLGRLVLAFEVMPNRFARQTTIYLSLSEGEEVSLDVYDNDGRVVEQITRGKIPVGTHHWTWEPEELASGVYFLRLQTSAGTKTHRVVLEK